MYCNIALAVTWFGQEHRLFGLNWSYLTILGFLGNAIFSTRFLVQWIASEKRGKSVIPVSFWYWSIAGKTRMRPMLMTAITSIVGVIPLEIGMGAGSEIQQPIAIVLIGGLITSTFIILVALPAAYALIQKVIEGRSKKPNAESF